MVPMLKFSVKKIQEMSRGQQSDNTCEEVSFARALKGALKGGKFFLEGGET